jgi:hypothetical protein
MGLTLPGGIQRIPSYLSSGVANNAREQLMMINYDFTQTSFQLIGSTVRSWYNKDSFYENDLFVRYSLEEQRAIKMMERDMIEHLAGQVMGVGDIMALKLYENYGVNPSRVSEDIESAVNSIINGSLSAHFSGVRKLGYWTGFSRAINY